MYSGQVSFYHLLKKHHVGSIFIYISNHKGLPLAGEYIVQNVLSFSSKPTNQLNN